MEYVIMTGRSGAGKSTALKIMEDIGYFCVDNLPVQLMEKFIEIADSENGHFQKVAFGVDVRGGKSLADLVSICDRIRETGVTLRMVFLDARDEVIIKRYKETRRVHPLAGDGRIEDGLEKEHLLIDFLREKSDYLIDTSELLTRELRAELENIFTKHAQFQNLVITVLSFGFKYGLPADADLVFDVRFLPNPYYVEELRSHTGNETCIQDYVMAGNQGEEFLSRVLDLLNFLIPNYIAEGKNRLVIAVGCTGGKHRSVTIANAIYSGLQKTQTYGLTIRHRDVSA